MRSIDGSDGPIVVCRASSGEMHAVAGICTHSRRVQLVDGAIVGDELECPKHNGRFRLADGSPSRQPVTEGLATYEVQIGADRIGSIRPESGLGVDSGLSDTPVPQVGTPLGRVAAPGLGKTVDRGCPVVPEQTVLHDHGVVGRKPDERVGSSAGERSSGPTILRKVGNASSTRVCRPSPGGVNGNAHRCRRTSRPRSR